MVTVVSIPLSPFSHLKSLDGWNVAFTVWRDMIIVSERGG